MNLNELHTAVRDALSKEPEGARLLSLAVEAERVADMTGWAIGPIDPKGQIVAAFGALKQQARLRFEEKQSPDVAQLHDALAVLPRTTDRPQWPMQHAGHARSDARCHLPGPHGRVYCYGEAGSSAYRGQLLG